MRYATSALLLLLLSSCSSMKVYMNDYNEPLAGETAMVRFSSNGTLMLIPNRNCEDRSAPDAGVVVAQPLFGKSKYNDRKIGVPGEAPAGLKSAEVKVAAGKPLTVMLHSEIMGAYIMYKCEASLTFLPKAGEQYQVTVNHETPANICRFDAKSLTNPTQRVAVYKPAQCP